MDSTSTIATGPSPAPFVPQEPTAAPAPQPTTTTATQTQPQPPQPQPPQPTTIVQGVPYEADNKELAAFTMAMETIIKKQGGAGATFVQLLQSYKAQHLSGMQGSTIPAN